MRTELRYPGNHFSTLVAVARRNALDRVVFNALSVNWPRPPCAKADDVRAAITALDDLEARLREIAKISCPLLLKRQGGDQKRPRDDRRTYLMALQAARSFATIAGQSGNRRSPERCGIRESMVICSRRISARSARRHPGVKMP
jgi:hypothetical protein